MPTEMPANSLLHTMIWAALAAFFISLLLGPWVVRLLRRLKIGQNVNALAPEKHQKKQGTPTMGGLMFAAVSILVALCFRRGTTSAATDLMLAVCVFALLNLAIGFADDLTKLRGGSNQGLSERQKLICQVVIALLFSLYCYNHPQIGSRILVPFARKEWDLGIFYVPVMMFIILCTTNGANFLDGLDGLLGSSTSAISAFFAVAALLLFGAVIGPEGENLQNTGILSAACCGALLGYLAYNFYPARMIMGDTGSMYLGGLIVALAMVMRLPMLIPLVASMYAVSLLSVFLQRNYYRLTGGKRIFKNSPLHHHFEMNGVKETKIVSMYAVVTIVCCFVALLGIG